MSLQVGINSYGTRDEGLDYCNSRLNCAGFVAATSLIQDQALMTATAMLDRQIWAGTKVDPAQILDWPRTGLVDSEGVVIPTTNVRATVAAITAGGTGHAVGDLITLTGSSIVPTVLRVLTISTGAITSVEIKYCGQRTAAPSNPVAQDSTTGAGTGATFTMTWTVDVPQFIKDATYELANWLISDPSILNNSQGSNINRLKAGSAEIWFFKPTSGSRFPTIIQEMIGQYLESPGTGFSSLFVSNSGESELQDYELSEGL